MWVSGNGRRKRHLALTEMLTLAARTGDFTAPWHRTPAVWEHFADEAAILSELQREWRTSLAGEIYVAIEAGQGDLQADVLKAFTAVSRRHAHARKVLEAHADHPAIAGAMRKEKALLSSFAALVATAPEASGIVAAA